MTAGSTKASAAAALNKKKPQTANQGQKRRNLKELIQLFRDNGVDESGVSPSRPNQQQD